MTWASDKMDDIDPTRLVADACARHADRPALSVDGEVLDYRAFGERIAASAARQRRRPGHRVGFLARNSVGYALHYYGALQAGVVPFLLDATLAAAELDLIVARTGLSHAWMDAAKAGELDAQVETTDALDEGLAYVRFRRPAPPADVPALHPSTRTCRFTSGTTGVPKCIEFSGQAIVNAARAWVAGTGLTTGDQVFTLAALSNGLAFNTCFLASFLAGATLHMTRGLPAAGHVARYVRAQRIGFLVGFPTAYRLLVQSAVAPDDSFAGVRLAISAGGALAPEVREGFSRSFGVPIADYYGIAETGPVTFEPDRRRMRGLGVPLPGAQVRIAGVDGDGEVHVRTSSMATRYLNLPGLLESRIDAEGFYRSSDIGRLEDDRLFLAERVDDVVNVGGRKVDPAEIASVVLALPGVEDAVVLGVQDASGETVLQLLVVVTPAGPDATAVTAHCLRELAPWKSPSRIAFVDAIARNAVGKPRLADLRSRYRASS